MYVVCECVFRGRHGHNSGILISRKKIFFSEIEIPNKDIIINDAWNFPPKSSIFTTSGLL